MGISRSSRAWVLATCLAVVGLVTPSTAIAGGAARLLPDLRMAKLTEMRVTYDGSKDRHLLRFTATILNVGDGPYIVRTERDCDGPECPVMAARQRYLRTDGSHNGAADTGTSEYDVGDGHSHWHVMDVESYELIPLDLPPEEASEAVSGSKVGFCFFDTTPRNPSLPGSPSSPVFGESGCGVPSSTQTRVGLSVGWGDTYPWFLPRQWIKLDDVPSGDYLVCATADPFDQWSETAEDNNQTWTRIHLQRDGSDVALTFEGSGRSPCATRLPAALRGAPWRASLPRAEAIPAAGSEMVVCRIEES